MKEAKRLGVPLKKAHLRKIVTTGEGQASSSDATSLPSGVTPLLARKVRAAYEAFRSFRSGQAAIDHPPVEYHLEHTARCNLACRMCRAHLPGTLTPKHGKDMDFSLIEKLEPELDRAIIGRISGAGEPMLSSDFMPIARLFKKHGCYLASTTNGTVLTPSRSDELVELGFDNLWVSVDGATAQTFESIRQNANFDKVVRNIRRLVQHRDSLGKTRPRIGFSFVAMRQNLPELLRLLDLMADLKVRSLNIVPMSLPGLSGGDQATEAYRAYFTAQATMLMGPGRVQQGLDEARARARALGIAFRCTDAALTRRPPEQSLELRPARRDPSSGGSGGMTRLRVKAIQDYAGTGEAPPAAPGYCAWPWVLSHVRQEGKVVVCCKAAGASYGDLNKETIREAFCGETMTAFRQAIVDGRYPCRACENCHRRGQNASFDYVLTNLGALLR